MPVAAPVSPPIDVAAQTDRSLGDRWYALVKPLCEQGQLTALVRELAIQGGLVAIDTSVQPPAWRLRVERETLRAVALRDKLLAVLQSALGEPLDLVLEPGVPEDAPARRDAAERQRRQEAAEAAIQSDAVVRDLLTQYKTARIVPGSIKPL